MSREFVRLTVPAAAEYLVTVRLVAASVSGRMGFDVDEIDDIKTACSEACLLLLPYTNSDDELCLELFLDDSGLYANISAPYAHTKAANTQEGEFSLFMLEALTDKVEFSVEGGRGEYRLFKEPVDA